MKIKGWELNFFNTGEWQAADEKLKDLEKINKPIGKEGYNPGRKNLFAALRDCPSSEVSVAIIGQDPYPAEAYCTGKAFSIPAGISKEMYPPTLATIFREYSSDLHFDIPSSGNLDRWGKEGVLLWNACPSCLTGKSLSHDWPEWRLLTEELVSSLSQKGIVFAFIGSYARYFRDKVDLRNNQVICTSHPSPRGQMNSKTPFLGSRLFSTINAKLVNNGQKTIDWRLE